MTLFCILANSPSIQPQPGTSTGEPRAHTDAGGAENPNKFGDAEADSADSSAAGDSTASGAAGARATCTARAGAAVPAAPRCVSTAPATAGRDTPAESTAIHSAHDATTCCTGLPNRTEYNERADDSSGCLTGPPGVISSAWSDVSAIEIKFSGTAERSPSCPWSWNHSSYRSPTHYKLDSWTSHASQYCQNVAKQRAGFAAITMLCFIVKTVRFISCGL